MKETTTLPRIRPRKSRKSGLKKQATKRQKLKAGLASGRNSLLGCALVFGIAFGAWFAHSLADYAPLPIYVLVLAMCAGMLADRWPAMAKLPIPYEVPLALGLILLGGQFSGQTLEMLGWAAPLRLLGHWVFSGAIFWLFFRLGCFKGREGALFAVGLSGSGISAQVAAADGDAKAGDDLRSAAVTLSLLAGALGLVIFPLLGELYQLNPSELATLAGLGSPTTAEAVMVGAEESPETLAAIGAWRFLVNAAQGIPVVVYLALISKKGGTRPSLISSAKRSLGRVPTFVWGLAGLGVFALIVGFRPAERAAISSLSSWCLLMALAGIGYRLRVSQIRRVGALRLGLSLLAWILGIGGLLATFLVERWLT